MRELCAVQADAIPGDRPRSGARVRWPIHRRPSALALVALVALFAGLTPTTATAQRLVNGAGATLPYPLYSKWFHEYTRIAPEVRFNYQSIGSGGGIRQVTERTVDFGASDAPMTDEQLKKAPGLMHIPTVLGAVVVTYNLPGNPKVRFTPRILADIFLGRITTWNDPALATANPDVRLPNQAIVVVHRSDGSGTTSIWADYLSKVSPEWERKVGRGTSVNWPVGIGSKGNEGAAGQVKNLPGALGYVEVAYALKNNLPAAAVQNRAGRFVEPTLRSTSAAAASATRTMPSDFRVSLTDQSGEDTYPVAGFTYVLLYREQPDSAKGKALAEFLWWAIHDGQKYAPDLLYAPLPGDVVKLVEAKIREITHRGEPLLALH